MKTLKYDKSYNRSILSRQIFFSKTVFIPAVCDCISGDNEKKVMEIFNLLDYRLNRDYVRQFPIGEKFVLDFAFVPEQIAIEVDGKGHLNKKQRKLDFHRDSYLMGINWVSIRIDDRDFFDAYKSSFWKSIIKEIVEERRDQWQKGKLFPIDYKNFNSKDYE